MKALKPKVYERIRQKNTRVIHFVKSIFTYTYIYIYTCILKTQTLFIGRLVGFANKTFLVLHACVMLDMFKPLIC